MIINKFLLKRFIMLFGGRGGRFATSIAKSLGGRGLGVAWCRKNNAITKTLDALRLPHFSQAL